MEKLQEHSHSMRSWIAGTCRVREHSPSRSKTDTPSILDHDLFHRMPSTPTDPIAAPAQIQRWLKRIGLQSQNKHASRITFTKQGALRYTGHLDLHRLWERAMRRASLPIAYSQGFHPQPKISLAAALPLGFASRGEVLDVRLNEDIPRRRDSLTLER
jgi:hypothetical protein